MGVTEAGQWVQEAGPGEAGGQAASLLWPRCSGHLGWESSPGEAAPVSPKLGGGYWCHPGEGGGAFELG